MAHILFVLFHCEFVTVNKNCEYYVYMNYLTKLSKYSNILAFIWLNNHFN